MSGAGSQNDPPHTSPPVSTLTGEMTETLAGFRAYLRFENVDPAENRHRFYDLTWQPTLFGDGALVRSWGRQGYPGTSHATFYPDRAQAQGEVRQVVRRRLQHGYRVIDWQ